MKKFFKIIISAVLCICFVIGTAPLSFAKGEEPTAKLNNVYGNNMLFQQKKEVRLVGKGKSGAEIGCELLDSSGNGICKEKSYASKSGTFTVTFKAPAGGYENYTINLYENGALFQTLKDVAFGELWLASGQSNMQYGFAQSSTYKENSKRSEWMRFLYVDPFATYNGSENEFPYEAQQDIESGSCCWLKGNDNINSVSAVSVYFAQDLQRKLDMPVGVLTPNLGGSLLVTWLARETVDSDQKFADYIKEQGLYLAENEWESSKVDWFRTMTSNYNKKVAPLRNFNIAGMIWYQGESEILLDWEIGYYKRGLELLQSSYSELFRFSGKMPFIATQVAPFEYTDKKLNLHNDEFIQFQMEDEVSRAITTIYDISLSYIPASGGIHPETKQPVGERMSACAQGLVYGMNNCHTAATVESTKIDGSDFYVTFKNTGDGLVAGGDYLRGFALCGEGGVYVQANAEIVSENTVRIFCDEVENPVAAAYAFSENNTESNLYSSMNGEKFMPVAPFATYTEDDALYWEDPSWARCDSEKAWFLAGNSDAGSFDVWNSENADVSVDNENQFEGEGCINVKSESDKKAFSISPVYTYNKDKKTVYYDHMITDWSKYNTLSVMVKNNGENDVQLDKLKFYVNGVTWFSPDVNGNCESGAVIPADGQWHKLTFDLDRLYLHGNECGAIYSRKKLADVKSFELCFKDGKGQSSDISIDDFRFGGDASKGKAGFFEPCVQRADNPWEFFCSLFTTFFSFIANIFKG
ncbi:MAG: hypothetical protein MJ147_07295 [Clostridia bacterium]|nr:hypothetical protein [Clostridia bacterium]